MTDREKVEWLAKKLGTLKRSTRQYSYISTIRYKWDQIGNLIQISEPIPGGKNQWRDV